MKPQKGLGRGLDAIFSSESIEPRVKPMGEIAEIEISKITPNPTQPRREFDQEALEGLADSIRSLGVIQPITIKADVNDKYIIISGERRWRASQQAGLTTIPAYIRKANDQDLHTMALVENVQRQDLNPIEISLSIQRLIDECGLTQEALAQRVGMKRPTISNYLRLLTLPDTIQFALKSGVITMGHAKAIAGADPTKQVAIMKRCVDKELSVRQTEELVRMAQEEKKSEKELHTEVEYPESYMRLAEHLENYFSQNISIKRAKKGGGKITIEFKDDQEIDTFISRLEKNKNS
ncbi:MAG: ParB/RepB/Spo0J family partition protein [Rikenellaceae bacterium]